MRNTKFRIVCGIAYGLLMLVAVLHFEGKLKIYQEIQVALVPYISAILLAVGLAYCNSDWYLPVDNEWPNFEYIVAPFKIILLSCMFAGLAFGLAIAVSRDNYSPIKMLELLAFGGIFSSIVFIIFNWFLLLAGSVVVSAFLILYAKFLIKRSTQVTSMAGENV